MEMDLRQPWQWTALCLSFLTKGSFAFASGVAGYFARRGHRAALLMAAGFGIAGLVVMITAIATAAGKGGYRSSGPGDMLAAWGQVEHRRWTVPVSLLVCNLVEGIDLHNFTQFYTSSQTYQGGASRDLDCCIPSQGFLCQFEPALRKHIFAYS